MGEDHHGVDPVAVLLGGAGVRRIGGVVLPVVDVHRLVADAPGGDDDVPHGVILRVGDGHRTRAADHVERLDPVVVLVQAVAPPGLEDGRVVVGVGGEVQVADGDQGDERRGAGVADLVAHELVDDDLHPRQERGLHGLVLGDVLRPGPEGAPPAEDVDRLAVPLLDRDGDARVVAALADGEALVAAVLQAEQLEEAAVGPGFGDPRLAGDDDLAAVGRTAPGEGV